MGGKRDVDKAIDAAVENNASVPGMMNELLAHDVAVEDEDYGGLARRYPK
jgi:hypothetical protein